MLQILVFCFFIVTIVYNEYQWNICLKNNLDDKISADQSSILKFLNIDYQSLVGGS